MSAVAMNPMHIPDGWHDLGRLSRKQVKSPWGVFWLVCVGAVTPETYASEADYELPTIKQRKRAGERYSLDELHFYFARKTHGNWLLEISELSPITRRRLVLNMEAASPNGGHRFLRSLAEAVRQGRITEDGLTDERVNDLRRFYLDPYRATLPPRRG